MKLITLCAVFSVVLAVSLASPARNQIRDISDSSSSSEENVADEMSNNIVADNEEDSSSSSSEEVKTRKKIIVVDEDDILDIKTLNGRSKRSFDIDNNWNSNNHIKVKDEGSIKYDKYLKLKRVRRATSNESSSEEDNLPAPQPGNASGLDFIKRLGRSAETSEENSSEEEKKPKQSTTAAKPDEAPAESLQPSAKPDAAPEESHPKPEEEQAARRRRSLDDSSEENQSVQEQEQEQDNDANEVFIFNNEKQDESEEKFNNIKTENHKYVVLNDNDKEQTENVDEKKISEEDYAQGCGENESNENSNENNETTYDIQ